LKPFFDVYGASMHPDQRDAMVWVIASVLKQTVVLPDLTYQTRGTLLSGWRLTTLVNTVLNFAYLEAAGCRRHMFDSVHNGDDVLAYCPDMLSIVRVLKTAAGFGIRAQASKCAAAGIEEFLRVDRAARVSTGAQYLARAVATAVHARAEAVEPESAYIAYYSQRTRLRELAERGAEPAVIDALLARARTVIGGVFDVDPDVLNSMESTHLVHGGFSQDKDVVPVYRILDETDMYDRSYDEYRALPGVADYALYLKGVFRLSDTSWRRAVTGIARATAKAVEQTRRRVCRVKISDTSRAAVEQELKGVCRDDYAVQGHLGKARLAGVPVGRAALRKLGTEAMTRVCGSSDPIRTMQIIF